MILVTGATGQLGAQVVSHLLRRAPAGAFSVLARDPAKAAPLMDQGIEVRLGDFDDPASLQRAFSGISKLLLISTMAPNRLQQHRQVIDAARQAGVAHVFYTGLAIRNIQTSHVRELMQSHFQTEDYLKASGMDYTLLRNTMYAEALPVIVASGRAGNRIALPGGDGRVPYVLRQELGEATANALLDDGHRNRTYHLVGSQAYGYADVAAALGRLQGTPVRYQHVPAAQFARRMQDNHASDFDIFLTLGTLQDIASHQYAISCDDLPALLGRPSLPLDALVSHVFPHPERSTP
jgi:NAD(P)H dehydrogenase (quinone)